MPRSAVVPQQDRSVDTRRRILDATVECLASLGYGATTTLAVGAHAGVSRGALLYHFPTRALLVSAAVQYLFDELRRDYEASFTRLPAGRGRIERAIDLLWTTFQDPRLAAVLELYVAGRTDTELRAQLTPVSEQHEAHVRTLARRFFPAAAAHARFEAVLDLVLDTLQGLAVRQLSRPHDPALRRTLPLLKQITQAALAATEE